MSGGERGGARMSTHQMAKAATTGRKVTFRWLSANQTVEGYLVGMDDYNWLITSIGRADDSQPQTLLVHKASPDLTVISAESSLDSETGRMQAAVQEIGRAFFAYCDKTFFGKQ